MLERMPLHPTVFMLLVHVEPCRYVDAAVALVRYVDAAVALVRYVDAAVVVLSLAARAVCRAAMVASAAASRVATYGER